MHDGNKLVTRKEYRKLFIGSARRRKCLQHRRGYQHDSNLRFRQTFVDSAHKRFAKVNVFFAEPDRDIARDKQVVEVRGDALPVGPRVTQKDLPKVR